MRFYDSPEDESRAIHRAASRAGCAIRSLNVGPSGRLTGTLACGSGWDAARLLLALAEEDAKTPGAKALAGELRGATGGNEHFARAIQAFVKENVRFEREVGEIFQSGGFTLAQGFGDCDDHFRLAYALARAGGLPAALGILHHGTRGVPREKQGPAHAAAVLGPRGRWAETTIDAAYGEHPAVAARRLGLTSDRDDIAKEVVIMTESDLPPVPPGFGARNDPGQVSDDCEALRRLGYLSSDCPLSDPTNPQVRQAVREFQRATGLVADGLLGPATRGEIARQLTHADPPVSAGFHYGIGAMVIPPSGTSPGIFTHAQARAILADAYRSLFGHEPSQGEVDFGAAVANFETNYGRAPGQFARWASEGKLNWGAIQSGSGGDENLMRRFVSAGLHPTKETGSDAGRTRFFYLFPDDAEAARAFLMVWGQADTLAAAATGSPEAVAAAMRGHGYYEGFHVGPGGLIGGKHSPPFTEEESPSEALRLNIADYASALRRKLSAVQGPGGIPDPARSSPFGAGALLVLAAIGGAAWVAHRYGLLT